MSKSKGVERNGGKTQGRGTPEAPPIDPAAKAFADQMVEGRGPPAWHDGFDTDKHGNPSGSLRNVLLVLQNDAAWQGVIALDEFAARVMKRRAAPCALREVGEWQDLDDTRLRVWLAFEYRIKAQKPDIQDAVAAAADRNRYNELTQFLDGLRWDRKPRLRRWLITYLNADDAFTVEEASDPGTQLYLQKVGVRTLIAAVARAYRPGCQVDTMTVLEGPQGLLKSTVWRVLGGQWFTDAYLHLQDKDAFAIIQGMWFVEWSELESLSRAEASTVKRFLTTHTDRYRTWYGKRAGNVPRSCVFVGTVNPDEYLKDIENRRIWPVRCGRIDIAALRRDRDQLLAEAVHWYKRGMAWWVRPRERKLFERQQERRYLYDSYEDKVTEYLKGQAQATTAQILEHGLGMKPERWSLADQQRVGRVMKRLGWERKQVGRGWSYFRPDEQPGPHH